MSQGLGPKHLSATSDNATPAAPQADTQPEPSYEHTPPVAIATLVVRGVLGGVLMGLANLVPGISGGTMLVAAGIYTRFIDAIAKVSTLRFEKRALVVLGSTGLAAATAILLLAGTVKDLVLNHRWVMYSLFIGLTLGGVPVVWKMISRVTRGVWMGVGFGFVTMAVVAVLQQSSSGAAGEEHTGILMLALAGIAGASAMILPGVSGGYLLLILGAYVPILTGIDDVKAALAARDAAALVTPVLGVIVPVGVGVVIGIVVISNLLRALLARYENPTLGALLGLLVGAVVGLWPFQQPVAPQPGDIIKGRVMTPELNLELKPKDLPTEFFSPTSSQVLAAIGLIVAGYLVTFLIALVGQNKPET